MSAQQETSAEDTDHEPRLIKRYTNRKLYDTTSSAYVTLDDLAEMIRGGEDVRVIDNRSKEDLTSVTLAQIIFEQQKSRRRAMPLSALRTIIQGPAELFQKLSQPVTQFRDEAAKQVGKLKRKEDERQSDKEDKGDKGDKEDKGDKGAEAGVLNDSDAVIAAIERLQANLETMQQKLDDQVQDAVSALHEVPDLQREIDEIKGRLDSLETIAAQLAGAVGLSPEQLLESMESQD